MRKLAISTDESAVMKKPHSRGCGACIALVVVLNAVMVLSQSNDAATADAPLPVGMIAALKEIAVGRNRFVRSEYRHKEDVDVQRLSTNGVMVAEDMRCLQCRGKCKAEDLRCRSQCAGEGVCLAHCEERLSKCEVMCKQIFQCE